MDADGQADRARRVGILRMPRKAVKLADHGAADDAAARQWGGAEKKRCRDFLDCGLFLILKALRADTTSNRGIGKTSARRNGPLPRREA